MIIIIIFNNDTVSPWVLQVFLWDCLGWILYQNLRFLKYKKVFLFLYYRWWLTVWNGHLDELETSIKISDLPTRCCAETLRSTVSFPIIHSMRTEAGLQSLRCLSLLKSVLNDLISLFCREQSVLKLFLPQGLNLIFVWQIVPSCCGYKLTVNTEKNFKPTKPHPWEQVWRSKYEDQYRKLIIDIIISNHSRRARHLMCFNFQFFLWNFSEFFHFTVCQFSLKCHTETVKHKFVYQHLNEIFTQFIGWESIKGTQLKQIMLCLCHIWCFLCDSL